MRFVFSKEDAGYFGVEAACVLTIIKQFFRNPQIYERQSDDNLWKDICKYQQVYWLNFDNVFFWTSMITFMPGEEIFKELKSLSKYGVITLSKDKKYFTFSENYLLKYEEILSAKVDKMFDQV
jgi:hypothetical protein